MSEPFSLSDSYLEKVTSWGGASCSEGWVFRPITATQLADLFMLAKQKGISIGLRGGGNSYGDAATNQNEIVLDLTRMKRILEWQPDSGIITVEPGVTLRELWEYTLADGWWPPVCTGTMYITIGGGAAMNVHGKNAFHVGTLGDHIIEFDLMLPSGKVITASKENHTDIFYAAIGGFGMLGCFTRLTLQLKRVYSGELDVCVMSSRNLSDMFSQFRDNLPTTDYLVGWVDCAATGKHLGRGELHQAHYLAERQDRHPQTTLQNRHQHLNDTLFGIVPRSAMWRFMQPIWNPLGIRWINRGKYWSSRLKDGTVYRQPHAQFHFLLNYFPDWKKATGKGGLIQYQPFIPEAHAESVFTMILQRCQSANIVPYLGVLKRHRADQFLMTHGLDGYSLALDFKVTDNNREQLVALCHEFDQLVLGTGGRFYPAKDSVLRPEVAQTYLGNETIEKFKALKKQCDPDQLIQTNFWRRVFASQ